MEKTVMMKCGHSSNAIDEQGNPTCVLCIGMNIDADKIDSNPPDLTGRLAKCGCGNTRESSPDLPFFEYLGPDSKTANEQCSICGYFTRGKNLINGKFCYNNTENPIPGVCINNGKLCTYSPRKYDRFYCGCRGWD